jgi:putative PIN family toxin of toxin-antitoxin system
MQRKHRIVVDTNIWISYLISKQFSFLDGLLEKKQVRLVWSKELLTEFIEVASRPKLRQYFHEDELKMLLQRVEEYSDFIVVGSSVNVCRDEKDNFLLSLSKDGFADFLLTADKDLLVLKRFEKTEILTVSDYIHKYL